MTRNGVYIMILCGLRYLKTKKVMEIDWLIKEGIGAEYDSGYYSDLS